MRALFLTLLLVACGGEPGQSTQALVAPAEQGGEATQPTEPKAQTEPGSSGAPTGGGVGGATAGMGGAPSAGAPVATGAGANMGGAGGAASVGGSGGMVTTVEAGAATGGAAGMPSSAPMCLTEAQRELPEVSYISKKVPDSWNPSTRCWDYLDAWFFTKDGIDSIAPECWFPRKLCLQ